MEDCWNGRKKEEKDGGKEVAEEKGRGRKRKRKEKKIEG